MNIPLRSEYDQNPLGFASSRSELWCKHLPQQPAGFHCVTFQRQDQFAFRQNSSQLSVSKNTHVVLSVHLLGGMIPQRVVDADALFQSSKLFVCTRLHLDSQKTNCTTDPNPVMRFIE